jgi:hypothetical protein
MKKSSSTLYNQQRHRITYGNEHRKSKQNWKPIFEIVTANKIGVDDEVNKLPRKSGKALGNISILPGDIKLMPEIALYISIYYTLYIIYLLIIIYLYERFEVFAAETMKNGVFGMLHLVVLVRTDVSGELSPSFIRVTRIGELGTMLAVTSNRDAKVLQNVGSYNNHTG